MGSLTLKRHNSCQNKNNRKATHNFAHKPLIFKLQEDVWKFNGIYVTLSYPKADLETKLFKLLQSNFEVPHFFSIVTFM